MLALLRACRDDKGDMNWYYIDGPQRVGPLNETEWAQAVHDGKISPQTLVWHEGRDKSWVPFSQLPPSLPEPEEAAFGEPELLEEEEEQAEAPEAFAARVADRDYPVDLSRCISHAWSVFKAHFWTLVLATLLICAIVVGASKLPVLDFLVPLALHGVLFGGLFKIHLYFLRGEPSGMGDLFAGFERPLFKELALKTLANALMWQACFLPAFAALKMTGFALSDVPPEEWGAKLAAADPQTVLVLALVFLACSIPAAYFSFCWMFAIPLIVDKRMKFWPAMQLSRLKVLQHPWRIGILCVAAGILGCVGILGIGIGIVFTLPLYYLVMLALYEKMFNAPPEQPAGGSEAE